VLKVEVGLTDVTGTFAVVDFVDVMTFFVDIVDFFADDGRGGT
jgi:hypothetical protein